MKKSFIPLCITFILLFTLNIHAYWDGDNEGWIVIVNGSRDSTEASRLFEEFVHYRGVDELNHFKYTTANEVYEFPALIKSDWVNGLNPGFWITVALITEHKEVAQEMVKYLNKVHGKGSYMKPIKLLYIPDIRTISILGIADEEQNRSTFTNVSIEIGIDSDDMGGALVNREQYICFYPYDTDLDSITMKFKGTNHHLGFVIRAATPFHSAPLWKIPLLKGKREYFRE